MMVASAGSYAELRSLCADALFAVVPLLDVRYACGYAVMAETMAMVKAVIATRTRSPSDLIEDVVTGLYVPPGDATALREAIQDPLRRQVLGLRAAGAAPKPPPHIAFAAACHEAELFRGVARSLQLAGP